MRLAPILPYITIDPWILVHWMFLDLRSCLTTLEWMDLVWSLHPQYTSPSLLKTMYFAIYMSLSVKTKETPLSAVRTIQLLSFLRIFRAFFFGDVGEYGLRFGCEFCEEILDIQYSQFFREVVFCNWVIDVFSGSDVVNYGSEGWGDGKFWTYLEQALSMSQEPKTFQ